EYDYAGWWQKKPIEVVKGPATGLPIPADAEIVLEGEMVPPEVETILEGPFSEGTGHYSPTTKEVPFRVKNVLYRNNPIILAQLPFLGRGVPVAWTHLRNAALLWSHLDKVVPGVKGVWAPTEFNRAIVISIEQKYGGHAKQTAVAALGQNSYNRKYVIVVDDDIDPSNIREVLFALALRGDPAKYEVINDCWCNHLHPQLTPWQREVGDITWSAMLMVACKPYYWIKDYPPNVETSPELEEEVIKKWGKILQK
ncbi:UbiD family decarboxylase domain-containing protein, partial [Chloroflexota bacterium]